MNKTPIEWTDYSVNPFKMRMPDGSLINACVHKSDGCRNCYAEMIVRRWWKKKWGPFPGYTAALMKMGTPFLVKEELEAVLRLSNRIAKDKANPEENKIFWNDMTDEYLDFWPDEFIDMCYAVRALTPNLIHQVLTKRADRAHSYMQQVSAERDMQRWINAAHEFMFDPTPVFETVEWPLENVWLGVSVEDQKTADERIPLLLETPATVRWVSAEPLLGPVNLDNEITSWLTCDGQESREEACATFSETGQHFRGVDWAVIGLESGGSARDGRLAWVESLVNQCRTARVPPFVKQLGTVWARENRAKDSKGGDPAEWPYQNVLNVREFPKAA